MKKDNVFNYEPSKEREHKKRYTGVFPSTFYKKNADRNSNFLENKRFKGLNKKLRKDNVKESFTEKKIEENNNDSLNRTYYCPYRPRKTEVYKLFENSGKYMPVNYMEPTPIPGKVDFDKLSEEAKANMTNVRKNGRKYVIGKNYIQINTENKGKKDKK